MNILVPCCVMQITLRIHCLTWYLMPRQLSHQLYIYRVSRFVVLLLPIFVFCVAATVALEMKIAIIFMELTSSMKYRLEKHGNIIGICVCVRRRCFKLKFAFEVPMVGN